LDFGFWIHTPGVNEAAFKQRTRDVALRVIRLVDALPNSRAADVIGRQLLRSATSIGANYRAACRSRSSADMISRLSIVEEEADESLYWLELLVESGRIKSSRLSPLRGEIDEIVAMTVGSIKTLRRRANRIQNPKSKI
jgi:four helix bundle protein